MLAYPALLLAGFLSGDCATAARDLPAGAAIAAIDLTPTACRRDAPRPALRYDARNGAVVATAALPAGAYLGRVALFAGARRIAQGEALVLRSSIGPITIERPVTAMQPGRSGERLFVRDAEGNVFPVRLALEEGQ
jgi:flagella basal body P-ring formation protein FlgA